jgi:hypothetical protein
MAQGRRNRWEPAVPGRNVHAGSAWRRLHRDPSRGVLRTSSGRGGLGLLLVRQSSCGDRRRDGGARRTSRYKFHSRGANRVVLERIAEDLQLFDAWSDEEWPIDGAAVRVSLVSFTGKSAVSSETHLNGRAVDQIFPDLTAGNANLTLAARLSENAGVCFEGCKKYGPFDVPGDVARQWLALPINPNGRSNSEVVRPWLNAMDIVRRRSDRWVVDFNGISAGDAALFEAPFAHVNANVRPVREADRNERTRLQWWQFERSRPDMRRAIQSLDRYIVIPVVAKHRVFVWVSGNALPSNLLDVIARDDDTTFGILHSRFHEIWALRLGASLEDRPRYTPTSTFETFPFPDGLVPDRSSEFYAANPRAIEIAGAARRLDELRSIWLNPPGASPEALKERTLTNLYNQMEPWLVNAHRDLDQAVAAAYEWPVDISDDDAIAALLDLNQRRAAAEKEHRRAQPRTAKQLREEPELGLGGFVPNVRSPRTTMDANEPDAAQKAS